MMLSWILESCDKESACLMGVLDKKSINDINKLKKEIEKSIDNCSLLPNQGVSGPHITLRYWRLGDGLYISKDIIDYIENELIGKSFECTIDKFSVLGEENTLVLLVNSDELIEFQSEIDHDLQSMFGVPPSDYKSFTPHISLATGVASIPEIDINIESILVDSWMLTSSINGHEKVWSI